MRLEGVQGRPDRFIEGRFETATLLIVSRAVARLIHCEWVQDRTSGSKPSQPLGQPQTEPSAQSDRYAASGGPADCILCRACSVRGNEGDHSISGISYLLIPLIIAFCGIVEVLNGDQVGPEDLQIEASPAGGILDPDVGPG